jgi:hypothetical protein
MRNTSSDVTSEYGHISMGHMVGCLKQCATSWKVMGSIPYEGVEFLQCTWSHHPHCGCGVCSDSNRSKYQTFFCGLII